MRDGGRGCEGCHLGGGRVGGGQGQGSPQAVEYPAHERTLGYPIDPEKETRDRLIVWKYSDSCSSIHSAIWVHHDSTRAVVT